MAQHDFSITCTTFNRLRRRPEPVAPFRRARGDRGATLTPTARARRSQTFVWLLAALLLVGAAACGPTPGRVPEGVAQPDKYLFEHGTKALNDRKWLTAREYFRQLVDAYPQSPARPDALLGIGDTYLGEGSPEGYINAQQEFSQFLSYYPTHVRGDYAQYKLALTHYYQMRKPERDQSETRLAVEAFERFFKTYPNSKLTPEVQEKYREARDRLSESIYEVGFFYFRQQWYPASIARFREVLEDDPQYTYRDAVYYHLAQSLVQVKRQAEALPYLDRLQKEFEQSEYLGRAKELAAQLKSSLDAKLKESEGMTR
ncbi:MAG: outer membrane protein assembly factor BamD [Luteitalea sp.]|nr:outer membrane protein assembly factor BamD [Luteitalea sp.]